MTEEQSVSCALARFAAGLRIEDLPADVVHQAVRCLVDWLGCTIAGSATAEGERVRAGIAALPALAAAALPGRVAPVPPILVGHSAGGHLSLYVAAHAPETVGGVLALAPVADLAQAYRLDLDEGAVTALLGGGPDDVPDRYAAADPSALVPIRTRTVVIHGDQDIQVPIAISRSWVAADHAAGGSATLIELPECEHFGLIAPGSTAWPQVVAALRSLHDDLQGIDAASSTR